MAGQLIQLHQEIHNELAFTCKLMNLILKETNDLKELTAPGGSLHTKIKQNALIVNDLGKIQQINLNTESIISDLRTHTDKNDQSGTLNDIPIND